jgi:hypothetical protein
VSYTRLIFSPNPKISRVSRIRGHFLTSTIIEVLFIATPDVFSQHVMSSPNPLLSILRNLDYENVHSVGRDLHVAFFIFIFYYS